MGAWVAFSFLSPHLKTLPLQDLHSLPSITKKCTNQSFLVTFVSPSRDTLSLLRVPPSPPKKNLIINHQEYEYNHQIFTLRKFVYLFSIIGKNVTFWWNPVKGDKLIFWSTKKSFWEMRLNKKKKKNPCAKWGQVRMFKNMQSIFIKKQVWCIQLVSLWLFSKYSLHLKQTSPDHFFTLKYARSRSKSAAAADSLLHPYNSWKVKPRHSF